jgi:hypothetical protein
MHTRKLRVMGLLLAMALLIQPEAVLAQGQGGGGGNKPGASFDDELTPLQKAIKKAIDDRKAGGKKVPRGLMLQCSKPNPNNPKCDMLLCDDCGEIKNSQGKMVGKKMRSKTVIEYDNPRQRGRNRDTWDRVMLKGRRAKDLGDPGDAVGGAGGMGARVRNAVFFPDTAINEDEDCIDRVTGEWMEKENCFDPYPGEDLRVTLEEYIGPEGEGCRHIETGRIIIADPDDSIEDACYDENNVFRTTSLEELVDEDDVEDFDNDGDGMFNEDPVDGINNDQDCIDLDGQIFRDALCFDSSGALLPGLDELIDEDDFDEIDQDGDGRNGEDPPATGLDEEMACADFGAGGSGTLPPGLGDMDPMTGECDMTRAMIVAANNAAMNDPNFGMKMFKAMPDGKHCDPMDMACNKDGVEFGEEMREVTLFEDFTVLCPEGATMTAEGVCVKPAPPIAAPFSGSAAMPATEAATSTEKHYAMMGFTIAPPVINWGYTIRERACIDVGFTDFCFEIFYARIGYEFDIAAGLRLPVEIEVTEIPSPSVLAGSPTTLESKLEPVDFTVAQYKKICEDNNLADGLLISDCDRFTFPDFLDSLNPFISPADRDGSELVAQASIFAGVFVRVVGVPIINWGVNSGIDLVAMCTVLQIKENKINVGNFGIDLATTGNLRESLKSNLSNCGSFTTPFGVEDDPLNPFFGEPRSFPFSKGFSIRADCVDAIRNKEFITIKGKKRPMCTKLLLGASGASLGIGLGLDVSAGSSLITADWSTSEDADGSGDQLAYQHCSGSSFCLPFPGTPTENTDIGSFVADNYDDAPFKDNAIVEIDNFTYYLNTINMNLNANLQFGGILSPIPDLASFRLLSLSFSAGAFGVPIGQHRGMDPIRIQVPVENYGLEVDARPATSDPNLAPDMDTLRIKPGEFGDYLVDVRNIGSMDGTFDNFVNALSNQPGQGNGPFRFVINPNTDSDCLDAGGIRFFGDPYNGVSDDCFTSAGSLRVDRIEDVDEDDFGPAGALAAVRDEDADGRADEDPPDVWQGIFDGTLIAGVEPYTRSTDSAQASPKNLLLSVSPFKHPLTAPGIYPIQLTADSLEARQLGLAAVDPSNNRRLTAEDVVFVEVITFFEPQVAIAPPILAGKPGVGAMYAVEVSNGGNSPDSIALTTSIKDFNQAGCTLPTHGADPLCPFRSVPTAIAPAWTDIANLAPLAPNLEPLGVQPDMFAVLVPRDWAGMEDTTYQVVLTVESQADPATPGTTNDVLLEQTVTATIESMTRYIGLEFDALIAEITAAKSQGISTRGLKPITMQAAKRTNDRALNRVLNGKLSRARRIHKSNMRIVEAFLHALNGGGKSLPTALADDWRARAQAILADQALAATSTVAPAL